MKFTSRWMSSLHLVLTPVWIKFLYLVVGSVLLAIGLVWFVEGNAPTREFYKIVESQKPLVDLSTMKSIKWDELVFVAPYKDFCLSDFEGTSPGNLTCFSSSDDGECWLLFLYKNQLVTYVPIDRRKIDLTTANFPPRLPRERAKFIFHESGDWAKVSIAN